MNEFELLNLFNEYFNATFARLNDFMAGTFALLISAYFAASKLTGKMTGLIVFLYTLFSLATITPTLMATVRFVNTSRLLQQASIRPESVINDLFPVFPSAPLVLLVMAILLLGAYAGSLAFFFHARNRIVPTVTSTRG